MKVNWSGAIQIASVYVGTVVGAGFATGKEIVEFFTRFGFYGLLAIVISGYLLIFLGAKVMVVAAKIGATSYQHVIEYLFGKVGGFVVNIVLIGMLIGVSAVMLSGAGAVFEEQLLLPKSFGILLTLGLAVIVMIVGIKGIFAVNIVFVPMMMIFSVMLFIIAIQQPDFLKTVMVVPDGGQSWKSFVTPFSYAAFNLSLAQAVLVPVANEIKDIETIKWGGMLGGAVLTLILFTSHLTLTMLPNVEAYEIPMAVIMNKFASGFYWIFIIVIYGEIFTSIIGNVFGLERQLKTMFSLSKYISFTVIFLIIYGISHFDYGRLLGLLYPVFGYISVIFLLLLWGKPYPKEL